MQVHYFPGPNGRKVSIALEEMGLAYEIVPVNILRGEQQRPEFLEIPRDQPQQPDSGAG
jgi:GSH-dependent disulfide-bond oxidoreductase